MSCSWAVLEILEYEQECIDLDCFKKLGMVLITYFKKKVNFDDQPNELIYWAIIHTGTTETLKKKI